MRNAIRIALAAAALAAPLTASAQVGIGALVAAPDCGGLFDNTAADGELYAIKVTNNGADARNDVLFDVRSKTEGQSDAATVLGAMDWSIAPNWRANQAGTDVHYVVITYDNFQIAIDGGDFSNADFGVDAVQVFGAPSPFAVAGGATIPGTRSTYTADLGATSPTFPRGTTSGGVNIAFTPLLDVSNLGDPALNCFVGAAAPDPLDTTNTAPTRGVIIGYNVYRVPDTGTVPTAANFTVGTWQYFLDLRTLRITGADSAPTGAGVPSPTAQPSPLETTAVTDLAGIQNPDGIAYNGDEVVLFQDSANNAGIPRVGGVAPTVGTSYWYAAQPVIVGAMADYDATPMAVGWTPNAFIPGDHTMDLDADTMPDAVSLSSVRPHPAGDTPEFISPQAEAGLQGMGLTHDGLVFISRPIFWDAANPANPLPATGQVRFSGSLSGSSVNLEFTTGLESGDVTGYNVYRVAGDVRHRVNDQPILAQGNESNVYQLVEPVADVRRLARGGSVQYVVEIVRADGTTSTVGPFNVTLQPQAPVRRR